MGKPNKPDATPDKLIDQFKEKGRDVVEDAREGETDDNPIKKTIREDAPADGKSSENETEKGNG